MWKYQQKTLIKCMKSNEKSLGCVCLLYLEFFPSAAAVSKCPDQSFEWFHFFACHLNVLKKTTDPDCFCV